MGGASSCNSCSSSQINNKSTTAKQTAKQSSTQSAQIKPKSGHLLRLWAEVFHVSAQAGCVRWTQVSDDLVAINVSCLVLQSTTNRQQYEYEYVITAYNSRLEKILNCKIRQPGTRLGQASDCFVYWKDTTTMDTFGLNFTSAHDAKLFRQCCSYGGQQTIQHYNQQQYKRTQSSYSLKDTTTTSGQQTKSTKIMKTNRQHLAQSAPDSPQLQCTCMMTSSDLLHKQRNGRVRYRRQDSSGSGQSTSGQQQQQSGQTRRHQIYSNRSLDESYTTRQQQQSTDRATTTSSRRQMTRSTEDIRKNVATTTDDLIFDSDIIKKMLYGGNGQQQQQQQQQQTDHNKDDMTKLQKSDDKTTTSTRQTIAADRSRNNRSLEGRRRSLERSQCIDVPSPPTHLKHNNNHVERQQTIDDYEHELRSMLLKDQQQSSIDGSTTTAQTQFELILNQSMSDIAKLMKQVEDELELIRNEERLLMLNQQRFAQQSSSYQYNRSNTLPSTFINNRHRQLSSPSSMIYDPLMLPTTIDSHHHHPLSVGGQPSIISTTSLPSYLNLIDSLSAIDRDSAILNMTHHHPSKIYLTSSEVSDDERLSLTTAISDDEYNAATAMNDTADGSVMMKSRSGTAAANFNAVGAVRKSGFLSVKKWLLRKKHSLELARKRGWKSYWVCLKGTTLLFYSCSININDDITQQQQQYSESMIESQPKHLIFVANSLIQSIPEHPKRDYVLCLSTQFGDAYLIQCPCQLEADHWINAIHSACAANMNRSKGKNGILQFINELINDSNDKIMNNTKLKAELELKFQVMATTAGSGDKSSKLLLQQQIQQLEYDMERLRIDIYRLKCYICSVLNQSNDNLPNSKSVLTNVTKSTKLLLNRLGVFTVSSLHAFINCRFPINYYNITTTTSQQQQQQQQVSTATAKQQQFVTNQSIKLVFEETSESVIINNCNSLMTIDDLLNLANLTPTNNYYAKYNNEILMNHELIRNEFDELLICAKFVHEIELIRESSTELFGFSVESKINQSTNELQVLVSRVEVNSLAFVNGIQRFDEIVILNGSIVAHLDMMFIESLLQEELRLNLIIKSLQQSTASVQQSSSLPSTQPQFMTDEMIESLVCPPPPTSSSSLINSQNNLIDNLQSLIVPIPPSIITINNHSEINDKLMKVVNELIDTETTFVQNLQQLLSKYLHPLANRNLLPKYDALITSIQQIEQIAKQQQQFLDALLQSTLNVIDSSSSLLLSCQSIARLFIQFADHFCLFAAFCAPHARAIQIQAQIQSESTTTQQSSSSLSSFIVTESKGQHSLSLESYLIKPIQRLLKYPLLLNQMRIVIKSSSIDINSEQVQETEAIIVSAQKEIEKVALHINEMQRIHEEYGAIFEYLQRQYYKLTTIILDLNATSLQYYGGVEWLNAVEFLGKSSGKMELNSMCFVFTNCVVFLCKELIRHKKKSVEIIRHQILIPVVELQVRSINSPTNEWHLIHLKTGGIKKSEKIYKLSNSKLELKNQFLKSIRNIIRQSVANMKLTSNKTPSKSSTKNDEQQNESTTSDKQHSMIEKRHKHDDDDDEDDKQQQLSQQESDVWTRRQDSAGSR